MGNLTREVQDVEMSTLQLPVSRTDVGTCFQLFRAVGRMTDVSAVAVGRAKHTFLQTQFCALNSNNL